jgi:hypothetical protein
MDPLRDEWRKSSFSGGDNECVEISLLGAVRDSKNPNGPILRFANLWKAIVAVKAYGWAADE